MRAWPGPGSTARPQHGGRRDCRRSWFRRLPGGPVGAPQPGTGGRPGRPGHHRRRDQRAGWSSRGRVRWIRRARRAGGQRRPGPRWRPWPVRRFRRPWRAGEPGPGAGHRQRVRRHRVRRQRVRRHRGRPDPATPRPAAPPAGQRATAAVRLGPRRLRPGAAALAGHGAPAGTEGAPPRQAPSAPAAPPSTGHGSPAGRGQAAPPAAAPGSSGEAGQAGPFWLRPIRRRK